MKLSEFVSRLWGVARQGNASGTAKVFLRFPIDDQRFVLVPLEPTEVLRDTEHGMVIAVRPNDESLRKGMKKITADLIADTTEEQHEKSYKEGFQAGVNHCKDALENHPAAQAALSLHV